MLRISLARLVFRKVFAQLEDEEEQPRGHEKTLRSLFAELLLSLKFQRGSNVVFEAEQPAYKTILRSPSLNRTHLQMLQIKLEGRALLDMPGEANLWKRISYSLKIKEEISPDRRTSLHAPPPNRYHLSIFNLNPLLNSCHLLNFKRDSNEPGKG